jgi:tRNA (Thr-GGU) A37 N-methylase
VSLKRIVVRLIPRDWLEERHPPDFLFTSGKPGRFNPAGVECVYFSEEETTAEVEYLRLWAGTPAPDIKRAAKKYGA